MYKSQIAAADYRRRAADALDAAAGSALAHVRSKLHSAAQAWIILAEAEDRRALHALELARRIAARDMVGAPAPGAIDADAADRGITRENRRRSVPPEARAECYPLQFGASPDTLTSQGRPPSTSRRA
jgi:hypothetical protein